jgi:hypothetical protein
VVGAEAGDELGVRREEPPPPAHRGGARKGRWLRWEAKEDLP